MKNNKLKKYLTIFLLVFGAIIWKLILLRLDSFPFNSDEAIVGLMARHILEGERPIFFYGQAYLGSLDAFLIAIFFKIFGEGVIIIRIVQILLYVFTIITTVLLTAMITGSFRAAVFSGLLMVIPNVNLTLYTTVSIGGYGEALLLGNLILIVAFLLWKAMCSGRKTKLLNFLWGLLGGIGLWVHGLTVLYYVSCGLWLIYQAICNKRSSWWKSMFDLCVFSTVGYIIGMLPVIAFLVNHDPIAFVREFSGSAVAIEQGGYFLQLVSHLINLVLLGFPVILGVRPSWTIEWLAFPIMPIVILLWCGVIFSYFKHAIQSDAVPKFLEVFAIFLLLFCSAFLFTSFGVDPSGRYFLPLSVFLTIVAGSALDHVFTSRSWIWGLLILTIVSNFWGTLQCALKTNPGITTQFDLTTVIDHRYDTELIDFLKDNGQLYGYSTYWVSYPLAFLSHEELIYIPRLPYHHDFRYTSRDDRYLPYTEIVNHADQVAYISAGNPPLTRYLQDEFTRLGIEWSEKTIGNYTVFYHMSDLVRPEQIGLGQDD